MQGSYRKACRLLFYNEKSISTIDKRFNYVGYSFCRTRIPGGRTPLFQIVVLRQKLDRILERKKSATNVAAGLALLDEFAGSVEREIDYKKEREESRDF